MNYKKISTWFIVVGILVVVIVYGINFFSSFFSSHENQLAKDIFQEQMERKLAEGPEKRLTEINNEVKKRPLTPAEEDEVVAETKEAEMIRKKYESKLTPPPPKPIPAQPKKEVWIFEWMATDELMAENPHQKPFSEYVAGNVICSEKELSFVCLKGKRQKDKVVLTRNDQKENYMGYLFNKEKKEYTQIWLFPEKDYFKGYIFVHNGPKILATLKKQNQ